MNPFEEEAKHIVKILNEGKIILYPTDTVWGIGCLITFPDAVRRIYKIIQRPQSKPPVLLVDSINMLKAYIHSIHPRVETMMGYHNRPLTVIYPRAKNIAPSIVAQDGSIAIRVCEDALCKMILGETRCPLVSISANYDQQASPKKLCDIHPDILSSVDYVVLHRQSELTPAEHSVMVSYDKNGELVFVRN